jgi:amino acid adenylation domain-containing protein
MLNLPPAEQQSFADNTAPAPHLDLVAGLSFRAAGAALRLGVFDHLGPTPRTAEDLAGAVAGDPRGVRVLLDALVGFGYAIREDAGYRATPAAEWLRTGYRSAFSFWHRVLHDQWQALEDSIRSGAPAVDFYGWLAANPEAHGEFQSMLGELADEVAPEVVPAVPAGARRLLDVGGGHARYATALCAAHPDLRADVVDLPGTLTAGRALAEARGLGDRVTFRETDWLSGDLGTGYDVVLLFNALHCLPPDRAGELVGRVAGALRPGGTVLILEETTDVPAEVGAVGAAWVPASSLNLFHTQGGQIYDRDRIASWLTDAGIGAPSGLPVGPAPTFTLFSAVKPAQASRQLTSTQRQMLDFDRLYPESTWYNLPVSIRIRGPLDVERLRAALHRCWQRHEALRSTYAGDTARAGMAPTLHELSAATQAELDALRDKENRTRFDLATEPPVRASLVRLAEDEHELLLTIHHIAADGYSLAVLGADLLDGYADPDRPADAVTRPEPETDLEHQLAYWRDTLADLPAPPTLPFASTGAGQELTADIVRFQLPGDVAELVRETARGLRSSPFMVLLTAFGVLLNRHTGADDLVIGTPVAGRDLPGSERVVDCLVNMAALRLRLGEATTWAAAVDVTRSAMLDVFDNADVQFAEILDELTLPRTSHVHPVFQVAFAATPPLPAPTTVDGVTFTSRLDPSVDSLFDLEVQVLDDPSGLRGYLKYRTARFRRENMSALLEQFFVLLGQLEPDGRLADARLLSEQQRHRAVVEWNDTATDYPRDTTLVDIFESRVDAAPDAVATVYDGRTLTYRELDELANRLAHALRERGIGEEKRVGLCLEFGADWVVAVLGVLKAGGTYVPLDPSYPAQRLDHMCTDSGVQVVVAHPSLVDRFSTPVLVLDGPVAASPSRPRVPLYPDHLAYVMYTSGSTGRPKGIGVTHRNIVRLVRDTDWGDVVSSDTVAQLANQSFDAATFELWSPLCAGARIFGVRKDDLLSPPALAKTLRDNGVDLMFLTTSLARQVAATAPETFAGLRQLIIGGEQADPVMINRLRAVPGLRITNGYGPTETTTFALCWQAEEVAADEVVPIGRPIANSTAYVLDDHLEPVAPGIVGEIYLGGDGVARGYLGRPDLTAERFVPDPFGRPGSRLYRSGDLGRYRVDGLVEYLGRVDRQVKIRGFRIEPSEVEHRLHETGRVREVTVQVRAEEELLVGYVVPVDPAESMTELRELLREKLPDYLVPAVLVSMEALPTNANGKLDVAALPAFRNPEAVEQAEPTSELERTVRDIWREVLDLPDIGVHDDFFVLGGHSIKAGQVMTRIRAELRIRASLRLLFDNPTIAGLAEALDRLMR